MKIIPRKKTYNEYILDRSAVDEISMFLGSWLKGTRLDSRNAIRCRLAMETVLLSMCEHFEEKLPVTISTGRRLGRDYISICYHGSSYDPLQEEEMDGWTSSLLSNVGLRPVWSYKHGVNEVVLKLPQNNSSTEIMMLVAFAAALLLGFLAPVIPTEAKSVLDMYVFGTISDVFLRLIGTFAGILIFLSVISGICGIGNISDFSKMGKYMVSRFIAFSFIGGSVCGLIMIPFFSFQYGQTGGENQASEILNLLKNIIPSNPVSPFMDGNMLQIVFMGVMIGIIIVLMSREAGGIRDLSIQANSVSLRLMELICKLLPLYIISSLVRLFWEHGMGIFGTIWKPLVFCVAASYGMMFIKLMITSVKCKVSVRLLLRKVLPCFMIGLTTASSATAFGTIIDTNSKKLGIPDELNKFGVPIGSIICCSTMSASFIAIIYYLTEYSGITVDVGWFLTAWFIVTLMTFAMPPVSGGTLVCLGVMFAQFGLPASTLGLAGILAILCDFFATSSKIVIGEMELVLEARHWEKLDYEKLRSE